MKYLILLLASANVFADFEHPLGDIDVNLSGDAAVSIATSSIHFDWSTTRWQAGIGMGIYDRSEALSVGVARKFCQDCPLLNGSIVRGEEAGLGFGMIMRF